MINRDLKVTWTPDSNNHPNHFLRKLLKGVLTKTGYKLRKETGILGNKRSTQEGREGNSQEDDKGNSRDNSCAAGIEDAQPKGSGGRGLWEECLQREKWKFSVI